MLAASEAPDIPDRGPPDAVRRARPIGTALLLPLAALLTPCGCGQAPVDPDAAYVYAVPEHTDDGWETASLGDVGMSEEPLVELMADLGSLADHNVHSVLIVRGGKLVFEEYFPGRQFLFAQYTDGMGFDRDDTHNLASVTKSITTTLFGIALDQGAIASVDIPAFDYFPEHTDLVSEDPRRSAITLEHLMLMTSGLRWNDRVVPYTDVSNDMIRMFPVGGVVHRVYMASGWGEQWIVVSPQDDLVFVSTGGSYFEGAPMPAERMLSQYVLRALR